MTSPLGAKSLLDAGCGEGFVLEHLLKSGLVLKQVVGLDLNRKALKLAEKRNPYVSFREGSITKIPYKDKSFDLVICLETLEHVFDYQKAITELLRVSKNYILISVPWEPYFSLANLLRLKNTDLLGRDPEHVNFWSRKSFTQLLTGLKVKIVKHKIVFPWQIVLVKAK